MRDVRVIWTRVQGDTVRGLREWMINSVAGSPLCPRDLRRFLWLCCGIEVRTANIRPRVTVIGRNLKVGHAVMLNAETFIDADCDVTLEDRVSIGQGVRIITVSHQIGLAESRAGAVTRQPVRVRAGAWIGATAVILPGVTIGTGAVVAAGAVVTQDVEANCLYAGVPARRIRTLI